jgi:hypothetical protein
MAGVTSPRLHPSVTDSSHTGRRRLARSRRSDPTTPAGAPRPAGRRRRAPCPHLRGPGPPGPQGHRGTARRDAPGEAWAQEGPVPPGPWRCGGEDGGASGAFRPRAPHPGCLTQAEGSYRHVLRRGRSGSRGAPPPPARAGPCVLPAGARVLHVTSSMVHRHEAPALSHTCLRCMLWLPARTPASGPLRGNIFERPAGRLGEIPGHEQRAEQRQAGQGTNRHPVGRDHAIEQGL